MTVNTKQPKTPSTDASPGLSKSTPEYSFPTSHDQRAHYDETYRDVDVDRIVGLVQDWRNDSSHMAAYINDVTAVHASWHGLYLDGFAGRLKGAKVLELGSGDGTNACVMAILGAEVTACDVSAESGEIIREIVQRTGLAGLRFESTKTIMRSLEPHSQDFVVGKAFLHHLSHEEEAIALADIALLLAHRGEARFFEPAVNSPLFDRVRWMIPVPGRPSSLDKKSFKKWRDDDPHPPRDNSSVHYVEVGRRYFEHAEVVPLGCLERFYRFLPRSRFQRSYRRWANRVEGRLPVAVRSGAARAQLVVFRSPLSHAN